MRQAIRSVFGWVLVLGLLTEAALEAAKKPVSTEIQQYPLLPSTCPARSVNYITESLPQQCLKTPWPKSENGVQTTSSILRPASGKSELVYTNTQLTTVTATLVPQNDSPPISLDSATSSPVHASTPSAQSQSSPSSSTSGISQQKIPTHEDGSDGDNESPLDNANFLSFEDWKRQNLAKAGQSPDNVGSRGGQADGEIRRRPGSINNALDSLGEDTEIEIDFDGFANLNAVSGSVPAQEHSGIKQDPGKDDTAQKEMAHGGSRRVHPRGKDAGKTCKERFNHASFDCAATVLKTNPECKGSTSVLVENKDSYLLNECSAKNKFFIVELCNDILVDTVVLANFEFFSSMFRTFRVSVSDRYPVKLEKWRELGTFEARNSREVQAFLVENALIWARYLRIEFLTHFGNEYFCPISLLRVHGTTMMEEFNHDVKGAKSEDDPESDLEESETQDGKASDVVTAENLKRDPSSAQGNSTDATQPTPKPSEAPSPMPISKAQGVLATNTAKVAVSVHTSANLLLRTQMDRIFSLNDTSSPVCGLRENTVSLASHTAPSATSQKPPPEQSAANERSPSTSISSFVSRVTHTTQPASESGTPLGTWSGPVNPTEPIARSSTEFSDPQNISTPSSTSTNRSSPSASRTPTSATGAAPPNPTTQESFFKSVHKRLQLLESNSTLSLQYIEEQSRILRDAFSKVEKRQLSKTSTFLESLNTTVSTEMRDFRNQYDQLWQSTVLELSSQRAQSQQEIVALSSRLTVLANEVVFQKRIAILQFLLILVCLGLVLFSRSSSSAATLLELPPVVQNALNKSSTSLSRYTPHFDTPPLSPSSTRPPSRYGLFNPSSRSHDRGLSDGSALSADEGRKSPGIEYSPPTPVSQHSISDTENLKDGPDNLLRDESPDGGQDARQTRSSPATPSGTREERRKETVVKSDYLRPD